MNYSTVDLPEDMPKELLHTLKKVWVSGQQLKISLDGKEGNSKNTSANKTVRNKADKSKEDSQVLVLDPRVPAKRPKNKSKGKST